LLPRRAGEATVYDRSERVPGFDQRALNRAHIALIGAGGLNGEVGHGLVRKGIGRLTIFDHDVVELSNLARQQFTVDDLDQNKALALLRNLAGQATGRTLIEGHARSFQDALAASVSVACDIAVVGVDNNPTRLATAAHYLRERTPVIFLAVDVRAARGYVFVQTSQPGDPCFLCLFPDAAEDNVVHGCAGASIEILKIVAGIALYAIDSLLMSRPRPWNYKAVFLDEGGDGSRPVGVRPGCTMCAQVQKRVGLRSLGEIRRVARPLTSLP